MLLLLLGPALVLASTHSHFYELSLCVFFLAHIFSWKNDRAVSYSAALLILTYICSSSRHFFFVNPLVLLPVFCLIFALCKLQTNYPQKANESK